jgi:cob(I)alamin adenosyltransferase
VYIGQTSIFSQSIIFVIMKVYTKKGDGGTTGLLGGTRVPKHHIRIESYGNVDELNSYIGLIRDLLRGTEHAPMLMTIQDRLFTLGSHLALDPGHVGKMSLPEVVDTDVEELEKNIDAMEEALPPMRNFVLPGGHPTVSHIHIARCICRRAERAVSLLDHESKQPEIILRYLNRLSDYLFVLSRKVSHELGAAETPWQPRK